ncbi:hypothetical protein [Streptomyces sp. NPDC057428]|uniref:hypothetical protein n=1 Tax=Streptomyces sp. NPDC057428 TaxID=3346129 RepID=UPI0036B9B4D3
MYAGRGDINRREALRRGAQFTALVVLASCLNTANRLNVIARQPAGDHVAGQFR